MSESTISAVERTEKPNKARRQGFIPGVVYERDQAPTNVKLDPKELSRVLQGHTKNTKVIVKLGNEVKHCFIKKVQKAIVSGQILHVELQSIHGDDIIRLKVPIAYHGVERLESRQQLLQEYNTEVELSGKASLIPECVDVEVGDRKIGDRITIHDFKVADGIKILDSETDVFAVVTAIKGYAEEEQATAEEQ